MEYTLFLFAILLIVFCAWHYIWHFSYVQKTYGLDDLPLNAWVIITFVIKDSGFFISRFARIRDDSGTPVVTFMDGLRYDHLMPVAWFECVHVKYDRMQYNFLTPNIRQCEDKILKWRDEVNGEIINGKKDTLHPVG